jgi:hypothetical protein
MQLVPYSEFGSLRLRPFCPGDDLYGEDLDEHGQFIKEEIRGVWFARWRKRPDELFVVTVHMDDCSTDVSPLLFPKMGLLLERGLSAAEVRKRMSAAALSDSADDSWLTFRTPGPCSYEVSCQLREGVGLQRVTVFRLDIQIPNEE